MASTKAPEFEEYEPLEEYKYPGSWYNESYWKIIRDQIADHHANLENSSRVVVTDTDADGLGCAALLDAAFDGDIAPLYSELDGPLGIQTVLGILLARISDVDEVIISDLCLTDSLDDELQFKKVIDGRMKERTIEGVTIIDALTALPNVTLYDHHQWDQDAISRLTEAGVEHDIRMESEDDEASEDDECATTLIFENFSDELRELGEEEYEKFKDLAAVTRDHDLYIKEDPRSDMLSSIQFHFDSYDEYVELVREFGANITDKPGIEETLGEIDHIRDDMIEIGCKNARWHEVGPLTLAFVYGDVYTSEVGRVLTEGFDDDYETRFPELSWQTDEYRAGDADIVAVAKPFNKVSWRSSEEVKICDAVAATIGGGGHPTAAGSSPDIFDKNAGIGHVEDVGTFSSFASPPDTLRELYADDAPVTISREGDDICIQKYICGESDHWESEGEVTERFALTRLKNILNGFYPVLPERHEVDPVVKVFARLFSAAYIADRLKSELSEEDKSRIEAAEDVDAVSEVLRDRPSDEYVQLLYALRSNTPTFAT